MRNKSRSRNASIRSPFPGTETLLPTTDASNHITCANAAKRMSDQAIKHSSALLNKIKSK